jgi:predicted short-subunit dehydrogenase-like oxidoreductase (DUF2520 family)
VKRREVANKPKRQPKAEWRTRAPKKRPGVVIVGFGRLGGALGLRLREAGWPVWALPRSAEAVRRAVRFNVPLADHDALKAARLCVLAVPDASVASCAAQMDEDLGPEAALIHCAGALDLTAFGDRPSITQRVRGSFHPLVAISDPRDVIANHTVALAASDRALMPVLWSLALALRLRPIEVPEAMRATYHAGAVMSAGLLVALLDAAVAALVEAQIERDEAVAALLPLAESALRGAAQRGLSKGLTGPIARGDVAVVEAHLNALPLPLAQIYRQLSRRALALVEAGLPRETRRALERLLSE